MSNLYDEYKNSNEWEIVNKAIADLISNNDLQLTTTVEYVVGYITKK